MLSWERPSRLPQRLQEHHQVHQSVLQWSLQEVPSWMYWQFQKAVACHRRVPAFLQPDTGHNAIRCREQWTISNFSEFLISKIFNLQLPIHSQLTHLSPSSFTGPPYVGYIQFSNTNMKENYYWWETIKNLTLADIHEQSLTSILQRYDNFQPQICLFQCCRDKIPYKLEIMMEWWHVWEPSDY